jgi:TolB-like protein
MDSAENSASTDTQSAIRDAEIRAELHRIVASEGFHNSKRLSDLLQYVVEESLQGRGDKIKAFTIAHDVFGRDGKFDQQRDTIVRVEAGRLRRRLKEYYDEPGRDYRVLIEIPKGGYSPRFSQAEKSHQGKRIWITSALVVLLVIFLSATWWFSPRESRGPTASHPEPESVSANPSKPFVAVLPLNTSSLDPREERLAEGFVESMIAMLAKLSGLSVMAPASMLEFGNRSVSVSALQGQAGVSHVLRGSLEIDIETVRIHVQLIDAETLETVWADTLVGPLENIWDLQDKLANHVTHALSVQIDPNERDNYLRRHSDNAEALALYRQALALLFPPNDMTRVQTARRLFRHVSELDPDFAGGYAGESFSHLVTIVFLNALEPREALKRGTELAEKAIETDPSFGMGHATMAFAQALSDSPENGLLNAKLAAKIQPGDAFVNFILGVNLILSGAPEEAFSPLAKALRLDPVETRMPYMNVLGIARYVNEDYSVAIELFERNQARGGPGGPHMGVFQVATYAQMVKEAEARALAEELNRLYPDYPYERWLKKWLGPGEQLNTTIEILRNSGLQLR